MALKSALSKTLLIEKSQQAWARTIFNPEIILTNDTKQHLLLFRPCLLIQQLQGMVWSLEVSTPSGPYLLKQCLL